MVHDHPVHRERLFQERVERDQRLPDVRHGKDARSFVKKDTIQIRIRHIVLHIGILSDYAAKFYDDFPRFAARQKGLFIILLNYTFFCLT